MEVVKLKHSPFVLSKYDEARCKNYQQFLAVNYFYKKAAS